MQVYKHEKFLNSMSKNSILLTLLYERIIKMDKNVLNDIISAEPFKELSAEELTKELDSEMAKPNPDFDLVDELTEAILEARKTPVKKEEKDIEAEIAMIKEKANAKKRIFRCPKWVAAVSAACLMLVVANTVSVAALGMNIFSAAIEFTKGGFSVDFSKQEQNAIELPTSESDPYGFIAKLAEYDISFETPHYIPDGFELEYTSSNTNDNISNTVRFIFKNGNQSINFDFEVYQDDIGQIGIPSDHYNVSETKINGHPAIVSKEDNQYTITYKKDKTIFFMFTQNVPYDECEKIIASIQ